MLSLTLPTLLGLFISQNYEKCMCDYKQDDEYYLTTISCWLLFIFSFQRTILDKILEHVGVNWWKVKTSEQLCKKEKSYMCTWTIGDLGEIVLRCKWETNSPFKAKLIVLYFTKIIPSFHNFPPIMSKWYILCTTTFMKKIVPKIFPFQKTIMKKILEQACID